MEEIYSLNINELWNMFNTTMEQVDDNGKKLIDLYIDEYKFVKNGVNIKLPILKIINEFYEDRPIYNNVIVYGFGKFKDIDFYDEIEIRKNIMRTIIIENYDEDSVTTPRVK